MSRTATLALFLTIGFGAPLFAADSGMMGGIPVASAPTPDNFSPSRTILENTGASKNFTVFTGLTKAAGLEASLQGAGPFTVFAPSDAAFMGLPDGTVPALLKPEGKPILTAVLTYHIVKGKVTSADIARLAAAGGGKASLTTIEGETLPISKSATGWQITDSQGTVANITTADQMQSNGVIHTIDKVLMPNK